MADGDGFDPTAPDRVFDAVLVDIDHSPRHLLDDGSTGFYGVDGSRRLAGRVRPGGVFALWSNDPPDDEYLAVLRQVFVDVAAEVVSFPNPLQGRVATNTVYLATVRPGDSHHSAGPCARSPHPVRNEFARNP